MNKKQIVQIVVIVIAFLGAGIVLYNGFFKNGDSSSLAQSAPAEDAGQSTKEILPYGPGIDWSVLQKQNLIYNQVSPPQLDAGNDFGIPVDNLIIPPSAP